MTVDFSPDPVEDRRKGHEIFQVPKEMSCQARLLYLVEIVFRNKRDIKTYSEKGRLRICHQQTCPRRMAHRRPLNGRPRQAKIEVHVIDLPFWSFPNYVQQLKQKL